MLPRKAPQYKNMCYQFSSSSQPEGQEILSGVAMDWWMETYSDVLRLSNTYFECMWTSNDHPISILQCWTGSQLICEFWAKVNSSWILWFFFIELSIFSVLKFRDVLCYLWANFPHFSLPCRERATFEAGSNGPIYDHKTKEESE